MSKIQSYVIGLTEPTSLLRDLSGEGLKGHWIDAVRGSELTSQQIHKATWWPYSWIAPAVTTAIGLSHIKAWNAFLQSDNEYAVILEEDAVLSKGFNRKLLNAMKSVPADFDLLYLGCFGCQSTHNILTWFMSNLSIFRTFEQINPYIVKPTVSLGLHGYVINKKGAQLLVDRLTNRLFTHVDYCISRLSGSVLKSYAVSQPFVFQTSPNQTTSTNTSNRHPRLISKALSYISLDSQINLDYVTTLSVFQLGNTLVTAMTGILLVAGIAAALLKIPLLHLSIAFLVLSILDIAHPSWSILLHLAAWLGPSLVSRNYPGRRPIPGDPGDSLHLKGV